MASQSPSTPATRGKQARYSMPEALETLHICRNTMKKMREHWGVEHTDWGTYLAPNRKGGIQYWFTAETIERLQNLRSGYDPSLDLDRCRTTKDLTRVIKERRALGLPV